MAPRLRGWLIGLLAGLFALALLPAPSQHARAALGEAILLAEYAPFDGSLPEVCGDHGGSGEHHPGPACLACVIMAAPGLAPPPPAEALRTAAPASGQLVAPRKIVVPQLARATSRARAPPAGERV